MADHVRQWRANQASLNTPPIVPTAGDPPPTPEEYRQECAFCGGYRDPWNMVSVMVHKDELQAIRGQLEKAAQGDG